MFENLKKTFNGLKISYLSVRSFKYIYFLELLCFTLVFGLELPKMKYISNYYKAMETSGFSHMDALKILIPYIIVSLLYSVITYLSNFTVVGVFSNALATMKENILDILLRKRPNSSKISMGETINSIKDDTGAIIQTIDNTADLLGRGVFFVGAFIMAFMIDKLIALIILLPLFSVLFLTNLLSTNVRKYSSENRKRSSKVSSHLGDIVNNVSTIKANGVEKDVINELIEYGEQRRISMIKTQVTRELMWKIGDLSIGISIFIALMLSARKLKNGQLSTGDLFIFTYFPQSAYLIHTMGRITAMANSTLVSYNRIESILGVEEAKTIFKGINYKEDSIEEKIAIENICKNNNKTLLVSNLSSTYNGENGVKDISFELKPGELLSVTGRIGSGKSTLIKTLIDSKEKDSGYITYCDNPIENGIIAPIGSYTPQVPNLFSDTVKNNIVLDKDYDEEKFQKAISDAVLLSDIESFKDGVDTLIGSKGVKLSGGQKQRVAVARMLYQDSDIYLLDDVSSALDVKTETQLWENLKNNNKSRIAITNRHNALLNSDKILVLKNGEFDSMGTVSELLEKSEEFKKIWGSEEKENEDGKIAN